MTSRSDTDEVGTVPAFDIPAEREDLNALVTAYAEARRAREEVSAQEKRLRAIEERAEGALFDELERLNLRSVRHELGLFTLNDLAWPKVVDAEKIRGWIESEHSDLITFDRTRLAPLVREMLREGDPIPEGLDVTFSRKINWRKA